MMGLDFIRTCSSKFFYHFGIHCATHQIRLILISGLVITSLFYPAIGIYFHSVKHLIPSSSSRIVGPLFGLSPPPYSDYPNDLANIWSGYESLHILEDTVARAKCGTEETIRAERILLTSNDFESDAGAINRELLQFALRLETDIASRLLTTGLTCLYVDPRGCLVLSPLEFWSHNENVLRSDPDLLRTIKEQRNISVVGLPLKASMVFAGRESIDPRGHTIDFAAYLATTYFFREDDCNSSNGHKTWRNLLRDVAPSLSEVPRILQEPLLQALEFSPDKKPRRRISLITSTLYLSYLIFFSYFSGSMRRMDTVHSRIGLCFTGLVEILSSTITSLSVCAIFGLRITLIPWGIFPIVIVFVGAENMFRLIEDVTKTPISLPVKERIGIGLGRAGTSNTLKVLSYNSILGVIAFFSHGAIRQFCAFAIVVLVAHWFLIHTFFVAVLSIDLQRLELDDLLRQNTNLAPRGNGTTNVKPPARVNVFSKLAGGLQRATKGRLAKNFSLMLLLVITAALYYSTLPGSSERRVDRKRTPTRASVMQAKAELAKLDAHSDARNIWRVFNAEENTLVHLKIEAPTVLVLGNSQQKDMTREHRVYRSRWSARTFRACWWIFKVMVVPIGATLTVLYFLLLYLLKGTDQLDNHHADTEANQGEVTIPIKHVPSFETFPRAFATDVGLLASSRDGSVLASASSDGELFIWFAASRKYVEVDVTDLVLENISTSSTRPSLCAIAVDDSGTHLAVGTCSGTIGIWAVRGGTVRSVGQLFPEEFSAPVAQIEFSVSNSTENIVSLESALVHDDGSSLPQLLAVYVNGRAVQWIGGMPVPCHPSQCADVTKSKLLIPSNATFPVVCFFFDNGELEIVDARQLSIFEGRIVVYAGSSDDHFVDAHACVLQVEGASHLLIAATTVSGIITLWDGTTGERIITIEDAYGFVNNLRILPAPSKACSQCGEVPLCSFSLIYSVGHIVLLERGILARRCSCPLSQPLTSKVISHKDSSIGRRSRSGSFVSSSGLDGGIRARSRHASVSGESTPNSFPVSAHGIHSRRGSEKDGSRRGTDKFDTPAFSAFEDLSGTFYDGDEQSRLSLPAITRSSSSSDLSTLNLWRNLRVVRVREATCERGGWGILNGKVLGLRRKPRTRRPSAAAYERQPERPSQHTALSSSVLDRWEAWILDPSKSNGPLQASSLSMLRLKTAYVEGGVGMSPQKPRLSFTRLSPLVIKSTICLAGFGNTIGMIDFGTT